eukprot:scaffold35459_cov228-Skeletonema_dohrnii-CCMP3373.AAC.1
MTAKNHYKKSLLELSGNDYPVGFNRIVIVQEGFSVLKAAYKLTQIITRSMKHFELIKYQEQQTLRLLILIYYTLFISPTSTLPNMKIIAFSAYLSAIASASASASSFQAQRLRGNQEARELQEQECDLERSTIADSKCARIKVTDEQAFRPTNYTAGFAIDGTVANWGDLSCGIPMWEAGNPEKTLASHAFLNWDCSTSELCILVKAVDGFSLVD